MWLLLVWHIHSLHMLVFLIHVNQTADSVAAPVGFRPVTNAATTTTPVLTRTASV